MNQNTVNLYFYKKQYDLNSKGKVAFVLRGKGFLYFLIPDIKNL